MKEHFMLPIVVITAFLCGVVYGYGMAILQRRPVAQPDPYLTEEFRYLTEQMTAPPPAEVDEAWIDRIVADALNSDRSADA
jgi:hypothetical protein